ncbi:hypothetical protein GYMLUDRAFT_214065 [Collybiopsis luxurians FD-317 M1]|nr:hypothetical protein GYMLUDRAFT_214065 [Collybiopsis luxurians FD-317 M1]
MGKKQKSDVPNPSSVSNQDVIQRLNFLYQASVYLNNIHSTTTFSKSESTLSLPANNQDDSQSKTMNKRRKKIVKLNDLSRNYIETLKTVGTRTTVQLDPSVKRTLCKACNTVLIPGSTASIRTKRLPSHGHVMVYTCMTCKHSLRIPAAPILAPGQEAQAQARSGAEQRVGEEIRDQVETQPMQTDDVVRQPPQTEEGGPAAEEPERKDKGKGKGQETERNSGNHNVNKKRKRPEKKKPIPPRLPPLFARDAGHVVFKGNEKLEESNGSWNDGIFIT